MHNAKAETIFRPLAPLPDTTEPAPDNSAYDFRPEFPPGYVEKAESLVRGGHEAASDPLPGPLLDAFLPEPLIAAGFVLRPVVASDWAVLKRIESPLLKELARVSVAAKNPELAGETTIFVTEDIWELLFLWTHAPPLVRATLAKGRPHYRETAMAQADALPLTFVGKEKEIIDALFGNLMRSLATQVGHAPRAETNGDFRLAPPATASAGGSGMSGR